jgi:hypothetical protein
LGKPAAPAILLGGAVEQSNTHLGKPVGWPTGTALNHSADEVI